MSAESDLLVIGTKDGNTDRYYVSNGDTRTTLDGKLIASTSVDSADKLTVSVRELRLQAAEDGFLVFRRADIHIGQDFWSEWSEKARQTEVGRPETIKHINVTLNPDCCYVDPDSTVYNTELEDGSSIIGANSLVRDSRLKNSAVTNATVDNSKLTDTTINEGCVIKNSHLDESVVRNATVEGSTLDNTEVETDCVIQNCYNLADCYIKRETTIKDTTPITHLYMHQPN